MQKTDTSIEAGSPASGSIVKEHFQRADVNNVETPAGTEPPAVSPNVEGDWFSGLLAKAKDSVVAAFLKTRRDEFAAFQREVQRETFAKQRVTFFTEKIEEKKQLKGLLAERIAQAKGVDAGVSLARAGADVINIGKFNDTLHMLCLSQMLAQSGDAVLEVMDAELSIMENEFKAFKKEYRVELAARGIKV